RLWQRPSDQRPYEARMQELRRKNTEKGHVVPGRDPSKRTTALLHQSAHRAGIEVARAGNGIGCKQSLDIPRRTALQEALAVGCAIRLFRPLDDRRRQVPAERLAQHVFLAQAPYLERRRQRSAELDHAMVEE